MVSGLRLVEKIESRTLQKVSDLKMRRENRAGSRILRVNMVGFTQILAQSLLM